MILCGGRIALAWIAVIAVLSKSASSDRTDLVSGLPTVLQSWREREPGETNVHNEEQEDDEQEENNVFIQPSPEKVKFIAGVPVFNYHEVSSDMARSGEFEDAQAGWVVMMSPQASDAELEGMCKTLQQGCNLFGSPSSGGVPFVSFFGTENDVANLVRQASVTVDFIELTSVELIPKVSMTDIRVDESQPPWGLRRIGAAGRSATAGLGATIFVLDGGVRVTHQEFTGRAASAFDLSTGSPVECNGDRSCAQDSDGHGTQCASVAAGETVGVAPGASVRAIKMCRDDGGCPSDWTIAALNWLALTEQRPAVGSMSINGPRGPGKVAALNVAVGNGVTVVVAAGNYEMNACIFSPSWAPKAITVGSIDSSDVKSDFSNVGRCVDIWAPGELVKSAGHSSNSAYTFDNGTSLACPHASGAAALIQELNKEATPAEVMSELIKYGEKDAISDLTPKGNNVLLSVRRLPCAG